MPRTIENRINENVEKEIIVELLKEFEKVNSEKGLENFFRKYMTTKEKDLIFRRVAIIKHLSQGKKYNDIRKLLRISNDTISKSVDIIAGRGYGQNPNRKRVFSKLYVKQKTKFVRRYKSAATISEIINDL